MKYETILEIDLEKLKNNTKLLSKSYSDYKYKIVDLKDNAHGMGLKIIDTMNMFGINYCLVGSLKEALEIRKFNKTIPILTSYYVTKDEVYDCLNNDVTITIFSKKYLEMLLSLKFKDNLNVQILIDNGSNILGINNQKELGEIINIINETKNTLVGKSFITKEDIFIGVCPIGHKDGITKAIKNVVINNQKYEVISDDIDKLYIKIDENIKVKDRVDILNEESDVYEMLDFLHTNRYYLMSILNHNLTKKYINAEEIRDNLL